MDGEARVRSTARRWEIPLACAAGALVIVGLAGAAAVAVPPVIANLSSEVSDGETETALGDAAVVVPADWLITRDSDAAITVRTPDGALRARLDALDETPAAIVGAAATEGPPRVELLASGLTAVHADVDGDRLVAGVGEPDAAPSVRVVAEVSAPEGEAAADYRAAIGDLLEGIRP